MTGLRLQTQLPVLVTRVGEGGEGAVEHSGVLSPMLSDMVLSLVVMVPGLAPCEQCFIVSNEVLHHPGLDPDVSETLLGHPEHGLVLRAEQVGRPDQSQVATRHPGDLGGQRQLVQVSHQVGQGAAARENILQEPEQKYFMAHLWCCRGNL